MATRNKNLTACKCVDCARAAVLMREFRQNTLGMEGEHLFRGTHSASDAHKKH